VRDVSGNETPVYITADEESKDFGKPFVSTPEGFKLFGGKVERKPTPAKPTKPRASNQPKRGSPGQFAQLERWKAHELAKIEAAYMGLNDPQSNTEREAAKQRVYASYDNQLTALGGIPNRGQLDEATAAQIFREAGGDKQKAREIAKQRGYKF
jgi:hypothetical protein